MMIIPRTSIGIEIAGQDLRVAVVRALGGKRRLLRKDVVQGFVALSAEDRQQTLVALFKRHKLGHFDIHLTLPTAWGVTRDLEFPAAAGVAERLRSAVALQVENLSPWDLDEVYWDCVWEPVGKTTRSILVHVAIVPRAVLNPWIDMFRSAGLALTGASLSSLSWAHGINVLWGTASPTMVLAAEGNYVEGALVREGRVHAVSMDGDDPAALVPAAASQLMRTGRLDSGDQLRIIAHGASGPAAGLEPVKLPVDGTSGAADLFGAISAALLGIAGTGFRLNLIPPELRYQRNYLQLVPASVLLLALIVVGLFALVRGPLQQSVYAQQLDQESKRLAVEVRSVADQEAQLNRASERLKAISGLLRNRDANLEALRELSRVLPSGTWLTSYSCQDNVATIGGFSESAAALQKILEDSPVFRDAQFTSSITRDPSGKDRFTMRMLIEVRQ